jgi:alkylation response protein AidB-like acyl-CoA dehydrogenase
MMTPPPQPADDAADELREVTRDFLKKKSPEARVRDLMETDGGVDLQAWTQAAAQLGVAGLLVPEDLGGSGAGIAELGVVFEEAGRALWCAPLLSTCALATCAVLCAADAAARAELLPPIAEGAVVAALAWNGVRPSVASLRARRRGEHWVVDGTSGYVVDGGIADHVLVCAAVDDRLDLFVVGSRGGTPVAGLSRRSLTTMDLTRRLAELSFDATPARRIGTNVRATLDRALDRAEVLLAAEQLGGATWLLEMAVDYAKTRIQFGRPIGSFQAIKHKLAEMLMTVELARASVEHAVVVADHEPALLPVAVSHARAVASDAYLRVAEDNLHVHGGIGFTWDHPAHLYLKRAKSSQLLLGSPKWHRSRLADLLGIPAAAAAAGGRR